MNLPFGEIASIWRAGCIIRARFLQKLQMHMAVMQILQTYFLMNTLWILLQISTSCSRWNSLAVQAGVPVPTFSSAIVILSGYRAKLPANLIQAQRDYFNAHARMSAKDRRHLSLFLV